MGLGRESCKCLRDAQSASFEIGGASLAEAGLCRAEGIGGQVRRETLVHDRLLREVGHQLLLTVEGEELSALRVEHMPGGVDSQTLLLVPVAPSLVEVF